MYNFKYSNFLPAVSASFIKSILQCFFKTNGVFKGCFICSIKCFLCLLLRLSFILRYTRNTRFLFHVRPSRRTLWYYSSKPHVGYNWLRSVSLSITLLSSLLLLEYHIYLLSPTIFQALTIGIRYSLMRYFARILLLKYLKKLKFLLLHTYIFLASIIERVFINPNFLW